MGRPLCIYHSSPVDSGPARYNVSFAIYKGARYDASTTNLTYHIPAPPHKAHDEPVELVLSFLSPVTPTSTLRQSIPAAYLNVYVEGNFDVDLYVDLNGQWVSGDRGSDIVWELAESNFNNTQRLKTWQVKRKEEQTFVEFQDRAEWGVLHFTGPAVSNEGHVVGHEWAETRYRTYCMNAEHLRIFARNSRAQEPLKTKWILHSAASWTPSPSSPSPNLSNLHAMIPALLILLQEIVSCSPSHTFKTLWFNTLLNEA